MLSVSPSFVFRSSLHVLVTGRDKGVKTTKIQKIDTQCLIFWISVGLLLAAPVCRTFAHEKDRAKTNVGTERAEISKALIISKLNERSEDNLLKVNALERSDFWGIARKGATLPCVYCPLSYKLFRRQPRHGLKWREAVRSTKPT